MNKRSTAYSTTVTGCWLLASTVSGTAFAQNAQAPAAQEQAVVAAHSVPAAPPGYPAAPPGYVYVQAGSPASRGYLPPPELSYTEGAAIPLGYRLQEAPRRGLVVAGYVVTGVAYGIGATAAMSADFRNNSGYLLVPILGPWLTLGQRNYSNCHHDDANYDGLGCLADAFVIMGLVMDGIMQAGGGAMLLTGYLATKKKLVREDVTLSVNLGALGSGYGISTFGSF